MPSFSNADRRSLTAATLLVVAATALRLGLGPGPQDGAWQTSGTGSTSGPVPRALRSAVADGIEAEQRATVPLAAGERVDPNFADESELRRLPGIGPAKAAAIVEDRALRGPFRSLEDLGRVTGLGATTIARLAPRLTLSPAIGAGAVSPGPIDLNRCDATELEALPGIGPVLARRIVEERARRGRYREVEDLLEVPGIGPAILEKIRSRVRIR